MIRFESLILESDIKRSFETGLAAYLVAETLASEQLSIGLSVIIDAVSPVKKSRDMWHNLSGKHNAQLIIIECVLDRELHQKRIKSRVRNMYGIPEITWEDIESRRKEYIPWEEERLVLDTSKNIEDNLDKILKYFNSQK